MEILKRIVVFCFPVMLFIALTLSLMGVRHIALDNTYYTFMQRVIQGVKAWQLVIPNIPLIPHTTVSGKIVLDFLVSFGNAIITIINVFVPLLNALIETVQFILTFIVVVIVELKNISSTVLA